MNRGDTYSLMEKSEKFKTPQELFIDLNNREPDIGDFLSCYVHCGVTGKSFLITLDVVKKWK